MQTIFNILGAFFMAFYLPWAQANESYLEAQTALEVSEYLKNVPPTALIFLDVDHTLITPVSKTLRHPPYDTLIEDIKKNKNAYSNYEKIISNWRAHHKDMLMDQDWPEVVSTLQTRFKVYGLTKMDTGTFGCIKSMEEWRYTTLETLGIKFSQESSGSSINLYGSSFYKGIFMTGPLSKSQTISYHFPNLTVDGIRLAGHLYRFQNSKPEMLVLVDDKKENLEDVKHFCDKNSLQFQGILFKGLEKFQDRPNPDVALFQKRYLLNRAEWLEDEEAEKRLQEQTRESLSTK